MSTVKLYELADQHRRILDAIVEENGELDDDLEAAWDASSTNLQEKVAATVGALRELDRTANAIDGEITRLKGRRETFANAARHLRRYLKDSLQHAGTEHIKTDLFTVSVRPSPPAVFWRGLWEEIPACYQRVKIELDAAAVLQDHRGGQSLDDRLVITQGTHLVIR